MTKNIDSIKKLSPEDLRKSRETVLNYINEKEKELRLAARQAADKPAKKTVAVKVDGLSQPLVHNAKPAIQPKEYLGVAAKDTSSAVTAIISASLNSSAAKPIDLKSAPVKAVMPNKNLAAADIARAPAAVSPQALKEINKAKEWQARENEKLAQIVKEELAEAEKAPAKITKEDIKEITKGELTDKTKRISDIFLRKKVPEQPRPAPPADIKQETPDKNWNFALRLEEQTKAERQRLKMEQDKLKERERAKAALAKDQAAKEKARQAEDKRLGEEQARQAALLKQRGDQVVKLKRLEEEKKRKSAALQVKRLIKDRKRKLRIKKRKLLKERLDCWLLFIISSLKDVKTTFFSAISYFLLLAAAWYLIFSMFLYNFQPDNGLFRKLAAFFKIPAAFTSMGLIKYYDFIDYLELAKINAAKDVENRILVKAVEKQMIKDLIIKQLAASYGVHFTAREVLDEYNRAPQRNSAIDELLYQRHVILPGMLKREAASRIIYDKTINQAGLARIKKINNLLKAGKSFAEVMRYADLSSNSRPMGFQEAEDKFGSKIDDLAPNQVSNIIYDDQGYYLVQKYQYSDGVKTLISWKFVFIKAKNLDEYLNESVNKIKVFNLLPVW